MSGQHSSTLDCLAIVPIRGGSKRLPGKHTMPLGRSTLIERTARCVGSVGIDIPVLLTTDSEEIAAAGRAAGWTVPFLRPADLANDTATTQDTIVHALNAYRDTGDSDPTITIVLQATSPFRPAATIAKACEILQRDPDVDAVVGMRRSAVPAAYHYTTHTPLAALDPEFQYSGETLAPNGTVYAIRTSVLRREQTLFPPKLAAVVVDTVGSIDIDTPDDWALAEAVDAAALTGKVLGWAGTELPWRSE